MKRRKISFCTFLIILCQYSSAQFSVNNISQDEAENILNYFAADSLKGRGNYTSALYQAAGFIANRFEKAELEPLPGYKSYFQFHSILGKIKDSNDVYNPKKNLSNVIGVLKGKSRPGEAVIISAHYDHLGQEGDDIFRGANDNASGTTALILLADYYARCADNERTLIFCAFSGEELGLLGSKAFSDYLDPDSIIAMVNIDMIGISSVGKKSFFITGMEYSDLGKIMERNVQGLIKIKRDPLSYKEFFKRSDNFPFAEKGVPAHTIMCSTDEEVCYHQPCDDAKQINFANMMAVIRSIPAALSTIVSGKEAPKRINKNRVY